VPPVSLPDVLPASTERIMATLSDADLVLDVGGWAAPFNRANWILDLMPYETRNVLMPAGHGPGEERFTADTWVQRDFCDREPWPFADDQFDFALCVTTLEDIRDPIWVCAEMSRVAKAGYVEVPTIEAELIYNVEGQGPFLGHAHHRWIIDVENGELVFMHKPHSIHHDWRLRVLPRWASQMRLDEHLLGVFWEGELRARERVEVYGAPVDEWRERVRRRFQPSPVEIRVKEARDRLKHVGALAKQPVRRAAERLLARRR